MRGRARLLAAHEAWKRTGGEPSEEAEAGGLVAAEDGWNLARLRMMVGALLEGLSGGSGGGG